MLGNRQQESTDTRQIGHHDTSASTGRELTCTVFSRVTYEDPQAVGGLASALDNRKQSSEMVGLQACFVPTVVWIQRQAVW